MKTDRIVPADYHGKYTTYGNYGCRCDLCRQAATDYARIHRRAKRSAGPAHERCDICGSESSRVVMDHDHSSGAFRGWLCISCNLALGKLGDDVAGIRRAIECLLR